MANETNFTFDGLTVYKEAVPGVIPANPVGITVKGLINYSVKDTQKTEVNPTLSSGGQASRKDRGKSDFAGSMESKIMGDAMPFIATHVLGTPTAKTNVTAQAWALSTAYAAFDPFTLTGDIVAHSDTTHNLVCKVAGTSGATEPDLTGLVSGDEVTDGTVVWVVRSILKKYAGQSDPCIPTFGAEYSATSGCDGGASVFKKRFEGNYLNSYEIAKANGTIIHKYALPVVAMKADDNVVNASFASIVDEVGFTSQTMNELPFGYDDLKVQFDAAEPVNARNSRMMINRNVSLEDGVAIDTKIANVPQMTVEGEVVLKMTKEEYLKAYNSTASTMTMLFGKANGDAAHFTFPHVERDRVDPDFSTNEPAYITVPLTASGDTVTPTVQYIIYSELDY